MKQNVNPESLELEITEGVLMSCHTNVVDILTEITALGINLSMDDFGTGYSSLSYLREYPFNVLKIDRSFIDGIVLNNEDCNLVKAIIAMSHQFRADSGSRRRRNKRAAYFVEQIRL
ncbi:EAL domain-containing protein [Pseudoalteromonas sp. B193]